MSKHVAAIPVWTRALLVAVAIPTARAFEVSIGLLVIRIPEVVFAEAGNFFGPADGLFGVAVGLAVIWIMLGTPFAALSWALDSENKKEVEASE